jgi:hypothetical protein
MKKYLILVIVAAISMGLQAQENDNYYWYQGEKIFLTERTDLMFIKLSSDANNERLLTLIQSDELVVMDRTEGGVLNLFVTLKRKDNSTISIETLDKYKNSPDVISANYVLEYFDSLQGLIDKFVVKLKEGTTLEQLQSLVEETNCLFVEENKFVKNQFLLSVPKTLDLNSLQMANLFYETELFEYSEPNFVLINAFWLPTGIDNLSLSSMPNVSIYTPLGYHGYLVIETKDDAINYVKIVDLTGRLVFASAYPNVPTVQLDKANKQGIYMISIRLKSGRMVNKKINLINN